MSIIRSLESFSLPELFRLIEQDSKSGRLIVETPISLKTAKRNGIYYIWFKDGELIAISDCFNQKGLINLLAERGWLSPLVLNRLRTLCPPNKPLGLYLRENNLLKPEQISLIFQLQLHQVYRLFQLTGGRFRFDDFSELEDRIMTVPCLEMTGHYMKATEVALYALRLIEDWHHLSSQLPESSLVLRRLASKPHLKLTTLERQLWELADEQTSLISISNFTAQTPIKIQAAAFKLKAVGLIEYVEYVSHSSHNWNKVTSKQIKTVENLSQEQSLKKQIPKNSRQKYLKATKDNNSILHSLGSLLKRKVSKN